MRTQKLAGAILAASALAVATLLASDTRQPRTAQRHADVSPTRAVTRPLLTPDAPSNRIPEAETPAPAPASHARSVPRRANDTPFARIIEERTHQGVGSAGMMAAIDPETGRLAPPTTAQRAELERTVPTLDRSDEGLEIVTLANGTEMMRLQGRFMEYAVARIDASGRITTGCVQGPALPVHVGSDAPTSLPAEE